MKRTIDRTVEPPDDAELLLGPAVGEEVASHRESPMLAISRLLWAHRLQLRKALIIGFIASAIISLLIPNHYEATVQLMPPDNDSGTGMAMLSTLLGKVGLGSSTMAAGGGMASDLLGMKNSGALFVGILRSRTVEDRLVDKFDLRKVYWRKTYDAARDKLESRTNISEDKKTGIISLGVSDANKERATAMAQAYVDELDHLVAQVTTSAAHRERVFLEQRLQVVHQELEQASKDLSVYSSKNTMLDLKEQGKAMVESAAVLQGQLIAAQSELNGLEQIYTPENVRVRSLRARVGELKHQLDNMGGKGYDGETTTPSDSLYPSLRQLPVLGVQYAELYRQVKIDETVFEILTQQYELAKVQEAKEIPSVKVLDAAKLPEKKSWPPRTWLTLGGTFLALFLASCWIVAAELWYELDESDPHKAFISQVWSDTKPFVAEKTGLVKTLASRWHSNSNGHSNSDSANDNGNHRDTTPPR